MFVDSHCHLHYGMRNSGEKHIPHGDVQNAVANGVAYMLNVCTDMRDVHYIHDISNAYDNVFATIGVHPDGAEEHLSLYGDLISLQNAILQELQYPYCVAIGECGLDYFYEKDLSRQHLQQDVFDVQANLAKQYDYALIVHSRMAENDTIATLKKCTPQGVMHCFTGDVAFAKECLDLGFLISFSGIVTFKNAHDLRNVVKYVPLDRMLYETDAPFLSPYRGYRNEPANIPLIAQTIAEIKQCAMQELRNIVYNNFFTLFHRAAIMEKMEKSWQN